MNNNSLFFQDFKRTSCTTERPTSCTWKKCIAIVFGLSTRSYSRSKIIYSLKLLPLCSHLIINYIAISHEPLNNFTYLSSEQILKNFQFPIRGQKYLTLCQLIFNFQIHCLYLEENFSHFFQKTSKTSSAFIFHLFYLFIIISFSRLFFKLCCFDGK